MKTRVLTFISFFAFFYAQGQTGKGNITGTVKDKTQKPVGLATIQVEHTAFGTYTDEGGKFTIKNIPQGNYTLMVSLTGFESVRQKVMVKAGETITVSFDLPQKVHLLKEVCITSTGIKGDIKDIPGTVSVIDSKQIQESGAQNIGQIITRVPGANYLDEGASQNFLTKQPLI